MRNTLIVMVCSLGLIVLGCGEPGPTPDPTSELEGPSPNACDAADPPTRTISCVESFKPGKDAGFGADQFPGVIYDEPLGNGDTAGGIDVLSLGRQGEITVGFGGNAIVDGPGIDFIVFENPFFVAGDSNNAFSELAEVSVSADGNTWVTFPCDTATKPHKGCAGYGPVFANGDLEIPSTDPAVSGGDQFDLGTVGINEVRFVRIRDLEGKGGAPSAGFDLDAVSIVNAQIP